MEGVNMNGSRAKKIRKQIYGEEGSSRQRDYSVDVKTTTFRFLKGDPTKVSRFINAGKLRRSYQLTKKQATKGGQ
jgi:hypothetical protein